MPFAIHSNPPKPKKAPKKLEQKLEEEEDVDKKPQHKSKPHPPIKKKMGEISICCDDEFNEDNN